MRWTRLGVGLGLLAGLYAIGFVQVSDAHRPAPPPRQADAEALLRLASVPGSSAHADALKWAHAFPATTPEDPLAVDRAPAEREILVRVSRGDTLMGLLTDAGVERGTAYRAIAELGSVFDVRRLQIGQPLTLRFDGAEDNFLGLSLSPDPERDVGVRVQTDGGESRFVAVETLRPLTPRDDHAAATIETSLYQAAVDVGMPLPVLMEMIRVFSFDVDFQRDIQPGDGFEVLYEAKEDEFGNRVRTGEVLYASMTLSGQTKTFYRFTPGSGVTDYFDAEGRSVRRTLMRTPVDGARLSSGFGKRRHPILGYTKMHKGVDFAAPRGTPIMAAGDGVVVRANRFGSFGNYLRIRHNSELETAYAHLNGFAKGVRAGTRVKQGQIVAYVGTTGRSTGPHLHYEVHQRGRQVNPLSVKLPAGETLKGADLRALAAVRDELERRLVAVRNGTSPETAVASAGEAR